MSAVIDEGLNGGSIGLTVKISFNASKAIEDLKATLTSIKDFKINLDLSSVLAATEEIKKLNEMKINIEGQQESLKYFTSVTQQLEKQVQASEQIRKNMQAAGEKNLTKQYAADQKELYNASLKAMEDIVKYEAQRASLTGKEKTKMTAMIKSRREDLETLSKMITMEQYSVLFADKRKKMENDVTAERLKQQQATKTNNEQKNIDRLKEAEKTYKRIVELRLKIYELGKDSAEAEPFKKELKGLNDVIRGYKSAKATKKELKKMTDEMDTAYQQGVVEIDQKRQKELEAQASKQQASEDKLRLEEVTRLLKRRQELELQLYKGNLTKNQTAKYTKEIESLNQTIAKLKEYESTKDKIKIMESSTNDDTSKKKATIDETVQKQEYDKTAKHLDSIGKQIKDLNKQFYAADGYAAKANVAERLVQLEQELDKYREIVTFKEKIAQIDREIATSKSVDMSKAMDKQEFKSTQSQDQINKAWSGEYYTQLKQSMGEALSIEKQLRQELFKTHGIKADNIQLDQQYVASLKEQGGLIGQLASNLQTAQKNIVKYKELTDSSEYNNVVKDHSVQEKQAKISRDSAVNQEKFLQVQTQEAKTVQELIPAEQRLLQLQLERLKNNKYLTDEQRTQLNAIEEQILALNGNSKKEVSQNARSIRDNMKYEQSVAALNKENLALEDQKRLEQELAQSIQQKTRHAIEDLETGKLAKNVDKERLETIRQMAESAKGLNLAELKTLSQNINSQLKDVKHQATMSSRSDAEVANAKALERFIQSQKESLTTQAESLKKEELKGYVLESNLKIIQAQITALNGATKEEVKENSEIIKKNINLEQSTAIRQREYDLTVSQRQEETASYFAEQEQANKKAKHQAVILQNKINELTAGKQLTAEQERQIENLKEIQRSMSSGVLNKAHYNELNDVFNLKYQTYKSEGKQANQIQAQQEDLAQAQKLLEVEKLKLKNRIEYIEVGKSGAYVNQEQLRIAKEMVDTLNGLTVKEVRQNARDVNNFINNISNQARNQQLRETGTLTNALGQSMGMFTRYFSGYMLVNRFFSGIKQGLHVLRELDETMTTLRITLTNFNEQELSQLMDATNKLAVEMKSNFEDVMGVIKTVANETENLNTILAKAQPALILSNLTGLATSSTVEMVQGVTRQYQSQFEAMGLSAEQQGMKVADVMTSISRSLGMDFATGIKGMAEGIEIMGALSNELGMSIEETMALMAATSEQTRLSFSEIANAFKTTMARTIRISGTEDEVSVQDLAKTEKALRGVGVEVRNFITGELRSFIEIMDDLAVVWDDLTDSQRGAVGDAMGGARQISTIMASINVTERRQELTKIAEESEGAAMLAQETWANGLEAKIKGLDDAWAMFWQRYLNGEDYHAFLDMMTSLTKGVAHFVEIVGAIPSTALVGIAAFNTLNKSSRALMTGLTDDLIRYTTVALGKTIVDENGVKVTLASIQADAAKRLGLKALTTEAVLAKTATMALQGVLSLVPAIGISAILWVFQALHKAIKDVDDASKNFRETLVKFDTEMDNIKTAKNLIKERSELKTKLNDLTVGTEEYTDTLNKLISAEEKLISLDERYKDTLTNTDLSDEQVEAQLTNDNEYANIQAVREADEDLLGVFGTIRKGNLVEREIDEFYRSEYSALKALYKAKEEAGEKAYEKAIKQGKDEIEAIRAKEEAEEKYNEKIEKRSKMMRVTLDDLNKELDYMEEHNKQVDTSIDVLGKSSSVKYTYQTLDKREVLEEIDDLITVQKEEIKVTDKYTDSLKKASKAVDDVKKKLKDLRSSYTEGRDGFVDSTKKLQDMQDLMDDISENGMTLDNFDNSLLEDFKGDLSDAAAVQAYLTEQIKLTEQEQAIAYGKMCENSKEMFDSQIKDSDEYKNYIGQAEANAQNLIATFRAQGLNDLADHYQSKLDLAKDDLENAETLAQSRAILEENLINGLQGGWHEYYNKVAEWTKSFGDGRNPDGTYDEVAYEAWLKIQEYKKQLEAIANSIGQNIEVKPPTISKPSSSSSSSSSSEVDDLDLDINRYHDLERAITRVNNALEANKIAQENAKPTKKIQLMKEEIKLYGQLRDAQKALYAEQKKEASELKKKLSKNGFTFNADGTLKNYQSRLEALEKQANKLSGDAKKKKIEEVKAIKEIADAYEQLINETLPNTQKEYQELSNTIKQAQREQLEYVADLQSQLTDAITEELQKRHDAVREALEKERDLYDKQYEEDQWEDSYNEEQRKLAEIQAQIDALSRDFSEAGRLKLEQLMEEFKEQQKVIDEMLNDKNHQDGLDRFDEALEALDEELEDLLEPESLAQMVSQALEKGFIKLNGEVIKTENLLTQMLENSGDLFKATGQLLKTELIDGLKVAQGLLKDVSSLSASITGNNSRAISLPQTSGLAPLSRAVAVDTSTMVASVPNVTVSFGQLLNVEGNLDTSLMLELDTKLRQAMNEVTHSISQALSYR